MANLLLQLFAIDLGNFSSSALFLNHTTVFEWAQRLIDHLLWDRHSSEGASCRKPLMAGLVRLHVRVEVVEAVLRNSLLRFKMSDLVLLAVHASIKGRETSLIDFFFGYFVLLSSDGFQA